MGTRGPPPAEITGTAWGPLGTAGDRGDQGTRVPYDRRAVPVRSPCADSVITHGVSPSSLALGDSVVPGSLGTIQRGARAVPTFLILPSRSAPEIAA